MDVDCLADGQDVFIAGIMEHIEEAGIHSGDCACSLPPHSLSPNHRRDRAQTRELAALAQRCGPDERAVRHQGRRRIFVLEVNPRASRTVPFVAKVIGKPMAAIAARMMAASR